MTRQSTNHQKANENAVSTEPASKMTSVIMNSFFRPSRSASQPKYRAPRHAPAIYAEPANPICDADSERPLPCSVRRGAIAPMIVTCRLGRWCSNRHLHYSLPEAPDGGPADEPRPGTPGTS